MGLLAAVGLAPAALAKPPEVQAAPEPVVVPKTKTRPWTSDTKLVVETDPPIVLDNITTVTGPAAAPHSTWADFPMLYGNEVVVEFLGVNVAVFSAMDGLGPLPFQLRFPPPSGGLAECSVTFLAYMKDVEISEHLDQHYTQVTLCVEGEPTWTYR